MIAEIYSWLLGRRIGDIRYIPQGPVTFRTFTERGVLTVTLYRCYVMVWTGFRWKHEDTCFLTLEQFFERFLKWERTSEER